MMGLPDSSSSKGEFDSPSPAPERRCPYCAEVIQMAAIKCRHCGEKLNRTLHKTRAIVLASIAPAILLFLLCGFFRIYRGGPITVMRIVTKDSFSFTDTVVNLDDLFGQPRVVVATQHPAVKRQLEQMGLVETDEVVERKTQEKLDQDLDRKRREINDLIRRRY